MESERDMAWKQQLFDAQYRRIDQYENLIQRKITKANQNQLIVLL